MRKSSLDDQISIQLTAYNNNLGLIKDLRRISLPKGYGEVEKRLEDRTLRARIVAEEAPPQFKGKPLFEYHIHDLQRKTTIKDKQTKQISLCNASGIRLEKELIIYGFNHYFTGRQREPVSRQPVSVTIKFRNSKENNLGMPLPAGIMRLYKKDTDGSQQFMGEDRIEHTAREAEVRLEIGEAFDVAAERV
ncbi:MAG: hypothetical protein JRK26_19495 [Deltaproteobacteria bacterium]|nr:hypothetical protein [Deltaproteobacteria bacterium]